MGRTFPLLFGRKGVKQGELDLHPSRPGTVAEVASRDTNTRELVHQTYANAGDNGLTPDEAAERMGIGVTTIRVRCTELMKAGRLVRTGERRKASGGGRAYVLAAA